MHGTNAVSLDAICTCKECDHDKAVDCVSAGCNCCKGTSHSMIMDGMEGFLPGDKK